MDVFFYYVGLFVVVVALVFTLLQITALLVAYVREVMR